MTTGEMQLPVGDFTAAAPYLRRPFTPAAIKFKVQATWPKDNPTGGLIVCYIDARLVVERLNLILPHLWSDHYEPTSKGLMWCHLTVDGITRSDVGEGDGKGLVSDALKRAAVKFGVGVSLYAVPKMMLNVSDGHLKAKRSNKGPTLELTPQGDTHVRGLYSAWLDIHGTQAFGQPLDHGDVEGAQGDIEADEPVVADGGEEPRARTQPTAAPVQQTERPASAAQRGKLNAKAGEANLCPTDFANVILIASGQELREFESESAAEQWLKRALDRLPARLVDPTLRQIERLKEGAVA